MKTNVLRKLQEKKGVSVLCEYCEDGAEYEYMDANETHYCNSNVDIYGSEEAFTREVEYDMTHPVGWKQAVVIMEESK